MAPHLAAGRSPQTAQTLAYFARRMALEGDDADDGSADDAARPLPRPPSSLDVELDVACTVVLDLIVAKSRPGAVLIFLPGMAEIKYC